MKTVLCPQFNAHWLTLIRELPARQIKTPDFICLFALWLGKTEQHPRLLAANLRRLVIGIQFVERDRASGFGHHAAVKAPQTAWFGDATGMDNDAELAVHGVGILTHTLRFQ